MTWYDRQYGIGGIDSDFTWFGIQFPGSDIRTSVWLSNNEVPEQRLRFATVRTAHGLEMVRFNITASRADVWTSPNSNNTYQKRRFIDFANGDFLEIQSVREDHEIYAEGTLTATSAFATVEGQFFGQKRGFALIDVVPPTSL
ncbi:hypothetical protein MPH_00044 [Macrophomina phaseolina MS6]|uniref:Uncharacterized protein n=1 Tax=Macrophomina phaseolina (strain MS6) TaxID=1126212 RepID=K2RJ63_MACPH|nr:hypothetical protein MPH_00044 [Macrophomina phaseolina MS6]